MFASSTTPDSYHDKFSSNFNPLNSSSSSSSSPNSPSLLSWSCQSCTLCNKSNNKTCQACAAPKPVAPLLTIRVKYTPMTDETSLSSSSSSSSSSPSTSTIAFTSPSERSVLLESVRPLNTLFHLQNILATQTGIPIRQQLLSLNGILLEGASNTKLLDLLFEYDLADVILLTLSFIEDEKKKQVEINDDYDTNNLDVKGEEKSNESEFDQTVVGRHEKKKATNKTRNSSKSIRMEVEEKDDKGSNVQKKHINSRKSKISKQSDELRENEKTSNSNICDQYDQSRDNHNDHEFDDNNDDVSENSSVEIDVGGHGSDINEDDDWGPDGSVNLNCDDDDDWDVEETGDKKKEYKSPKLSSSPSLLSQSEDLLVTQPSTAPMIDCGYTLLTPSAVEEEINDFIRTTAEVLGLSSSQTGILLRFYHWHHQQLEENWFNDANAVARKCGISTEIDNDPIEVECEEYYKQKLNKDQETKYPDKEDSQETYKKRKVSEGERESKDVNMNNNNNSSNIIDSVSSCQLCFDDVPSSQLYSLSCGKDHLYCSNCWQSWINAEFETKVASCINTHCMGNKCSYIIPYHRALYYLGFSTDKADLYRRWLMEDYIQCHKRMKWCPGAGCQLCVVATSDVVGDVECKCGHSWCFECSGLTHMPASCFDAHQWNVKNNSESENSQH